MIPVGSSKPSFSISPASITHVEGDAGTISYTYDVTRAVVTTGAATIDWSVAGSGVNPANSSDFSSMSGTLSYASGETVKQIVVQVTGDTTTEQDEEFTVTISNPSLDANIIQATAQGIIVNDDVLLTAQPITIPDATWGVPYSATGAATGWANGTYDLGNGITLSVTSQVYTASGTPY